MLEALLLQEIRDELREIRREMKVRPWMTVSQAAEYFDVSEKTIRRRIENGDLIAKKEGSQWRVLTV